MAVDLLADDRKTPCGKDLEVVDVIIGVVDLLTLLAAWGPCPLSVGCQGDCDGDGMVGVTDLLLLLGSWG